MTGEASLSLRYQWEASEGVRSPELRATFARLEVGFGSEIITRLEDSATESSRRSLYVPLYPLAEWIAYNWWFLFWHSRPERIGRRYWSLQGHSGGPFNQWLSHHNLRAVGDGFLWPDLTIVPDSGSGVAVAWRADSQSTYSTARFLAQGEGWTTKDALRETLSGFVESVLTRLREAGVKRTPLDEEWDELRTLDSEEIAFCEAAARLGLDASAVPESVEDVILEADRVLEESLFEDFLRAAKPELLGEDLEWIESSSERIRSLESDRQTLARVSLQASGQPWHQGMAVAQRLRLVLGAKPTDQLDPEDFVSVLTDALRDRGLEGLGGLSSGDQPVLVLGSDRTSQSKRFAAARSLILFMGGAHRFLITSAYGPAQKRERAFAAELLAPVDGIKEMLGPDAEFVRDLDVARISDHFDVSELVVTHQVENNFDIPMEARLA